MLAGVLLAVLLTRALGCQIRSSERAGERAPKRCRRSRSTSAHAVSAAARMILQRSNCGRVPISDNLLLQMRRLKPYPLFGDAR